MPEDQFETSTRVVGFFRLSGTSDDRERRRERIENEDSVVSGMVSSAGAS
jgi:hypothetical protein